MMDKAKKLGPITDNLNKSLEKLLDNFAYNTEWTDINNWLRSLQAVLKDNPSPYINQKVLLSKRLNQCINPILPQKTHQQVLIIHNLLFLNIRSNCDNNINEYIKMFAEDLGIYSVSIIPYFNHTSSAEHRLMILKMLSDYYLDLELQLIPMLTGIMKSILPVYNQNKNKILTSQIQKFMIRLLQKAGRRYAISSIWTCILKFSDCRIAGVKFLGKFINKMDFMKGEEDFDSQHGFSQEQRQIQRQQQELRRLDQMKMATHDNNNNAISIRAPILDRYNNEMHEGSFQQLNQSQKLGYQNQQLSQQRKQKLSKIREVSEQDDLTQKKKSSRIDQKEDNTFDQKSQKNLRLLATSQGPNSFLHHDLIAEPEQNQENDGHPIKLDKVPLMLTPGIQLIKQGINLDTVENNFPHHNILVVNSLISCLEDASPFIKRSTLDFMFTHLRLKSNVFDQNDRKLLVQAGIRLFKKKQVSVIKRVNKWLFGRQNQQNMYEINQKNQFVIPYIVHAFKKILSSQPTDLQTSVVPLKIVQNFYMQHPYLLDLTISNISIDLLRYVFNFSEGFEYSQEIVKAGSRFFSNIPSHYKLLFMSIGKSFIEGVTKDDNHLAFQCIKYLDYCYIKLMKHQHNVQQIQYITITLSLLSQGLQQFAKKHSQQNAEFYKPYLRDANLLILNLISRRESVQRYMNKQRQMVDKKYLEQSGMTQLPPERIKYQNNIREQLLKYQDVYVQIQKRMQTFFIVLSQIIKRTPNIQTFQDIYKLSSMSIVKLQSLMPQNYILKELPKWFSAVQYGIRVTSPVVSLAAIQAMIKCLMFQDKHPIYAQFKRLTLQDKNSKSGNDYQNLALQKLWALLDYPHMHNKIIDLIVAFSKYFPNQFTQTVKRSFQTHSDPQKQASIQRFSHFWRLTGFKYKDLLISNRQFAQLNKVGLFKMLDFLDDQNPLVRNAAKNWMIQSMPLFHRVLQPLFYQLMKVGCDWYTTPKGIMIIQHSYDTNIVFSTFRRLRSLLDNGTFGFLRYIYQQPISDRLQQLRDKVTQINTSILTDFDNKQSPLPMIDPSLQKQPVLPKALQYVPESVKQKHMAYIDMLIILCVKYLQGIAIQSMGLDFYTGNAGVNASSIQLLQSMINYIDNPKLCYKLIDYIMEPLCKVLNQAVLNKQYITQIQLLNLLKTVFFNSSFRKKGQVQQIRQFFKNVFTKPYFLPSMLNGLNTPFAYVRAQFISFITSCIQLIANFLEPDQCTQCIKHILFSYYKIIKQIRVSLIQQVLEEQDKNLDAINQYQQSKKQNQLTTSRIVQLELKSKQQQKLVKLSNNLQQVAKTNEILSILHGVQAILNYFYDLDKMNISQMKFEIANPYTIFDSLKTIVTFGLASSQKLGKLIQKTQFLHNMETAQSILQDLSPVYETILRAWPLSQQFVRIATEQFTSIGSRSFNFQKFSRYNKVLADLITFVNNEKQTIWGMIFSILKPMFYRFPKQIMEIYLKLWVRQCTNAGEGKKQMNVNEKLAIKSNVANTQFLMKNLQTIVVSNFPMNIIVHAFLQTSMLEQIKDYYINRKRQKKQATLSFHISQLQAKLLYFLYVYFMYSHIDQKSLNKQRLLDIWSIILKAIRPFINSNTPTTAIWIIDIINMCAVKYSPKEILVNQKFKTDLHGITNQLLRQIANTASKKDPLFYEDPTKVTINEIQDKYRVVLPLPPCLFQIYKTKKKDRKDIDKKLFNSAKLGEVVQIQKINRLWSFKALKKNGYEVLQNTYLPQKLHFAVIRACQWMQMILPVIQDKSIQNMIYAQFASQVLYNLLEQARMVFIKPLRESIIRIFDKDDFFICNKNTLDYWAKIIDWVVSIDKKNQTFQEYLEKVSLSSSYFTSEDKQNKKRIKSFQRICFILYSGQQDKYAFKIKGLLQKIADVIKIAQAAHPALLILILFSIRILILRLSQISLNQLFIDIWPMILAFLMQIFSKKMVKVQVANQISKNPNLILAALKLIQMISISNLTQFAHHQWIFIYDYFGLKISLLQNNVQLSTILSQRPELSMIPNFNRVQKEAPFHYQPYMLNYLPPHSIQFIPPAQKAIQQNKLQYQPIKRQIIITNSFVKTQQQLKAYAYLLMQYLVHLDQFRVNIDMKHVQEVIINDFIKLDSFIHSI